MKMAFVYVTEQGAVLKKTGERLLVEKDEETLLDIPADKVEGVLVFGNVQFTTQAAQLLLNQGVEMALFTRHGRLLGQLTSPFTKNITLRQAQYAKSGDPRFALAFCKAIIEAKVSNSLELIREFSHNHPETALSEETSQIATLLPRVGEALDLSRILGLEGASSHSYFQAFGKMIRHSFNFEGRIRRPAPDPVNALLSLGYTMLYNEICSLLDGMGFDPYLGFYHQPRYGHATLASDLMEEFRSPLTDRFTLGVVNNRIFQEGDFFFHQPSGAMYLNDDARKRYFVEYERFITRPMSEADETDEANFRKLFRRQAERLNRALTKGEEYRPYRFRW
jgi:CRISPR-associated protein Cas1